MCDLQSLRSACTYAQSDQSLCLSLEYSMSLKRLTEHHLEFLSLKGGLQACLSLHLSKCNIVGNHMPRLKCLRGLRQGSFKTQISVHSHSYRDYIEYLKLIHKISFFGFAIRSMICAFFVHMQTKWLDLTNAKHETHTLNKLVTSREKYRDIYKIYSLC